MILSLGVIASYIFSDAAQTRQERDLAVRETQAITALESYLQARSASYDQALRGAAGMISIVGRENVTKEKWNVFVKNLSANTRLGEVLGIGIADSVTSQSISEYERREGISVRPEGTRQMYSVIRYLEPATERNQAAIGFDMFSESIRRMAMTQASLSNKSIMSGPIIAVQDSTLPTNEQPYSVLMYHPFYQFSDQATRSLSQGYAYLIFRPSDVLKKIDALEKNKYDLSVDDITNSRAPVRLFASEGYQNAPSSRLYRDIEINSRKWRLNLSVRERQYTLFNSFSLFMTGLAGSCVLALMAYILMRSRSERVNVRHRDDIQRTKDDLLALASHQLRTPATGVSQYLAMLQEGYFGSLNEKQSEVAAKASAANHRQLEIIDQLLYVAKADAGQLIVAPSTLDVTEILKNSIEEHAGQAAKKDIAFKTKIPKHLTCYVDCKYTTMIIENIINNAVKYSHPSSNIHISLKRRRHDDMAELSVKDSGVGISDEDQTRIFQKFTRINNPLSQSEGGSGLGLYLAKKLATSQGGDILVESIQARGTTFTLLLPLHERDTDTVVDLSKE